MSLTGTRRIALASILLCCGLSAFWGFFLQRNSPEGLGDFKGVFYAARCLLQHNDPYKEGEKLRVYQAEEGGPSMPPDGLRSILMRHIYFPPTFIFIAPFAILPWVPAHLLWMVLTAGSLILATFLIWNLAEDYSPGVSLFLICFVLINCEGLFATGNPAGIVVSLCIVTVWCFLRNRFVPAGILCLAVSLAIKPHDVGLVWLYFLLAAGAYRKHALQTLMVTVVLAVPAILWVSYVAPNWMQELHSAIRADFALGGPCNPGPNFVSGNGPRMVLDLQSTISVFRDDPHIYNPVSYLVCGALLLVGAIHTLRSRFSQTRAWLALAAIAPLTLLVTYHQYVDAKLLLLAVPACAMLWAGGGLTRWIALLVTSAGIVSTADIPLTLFLALTRNIPTAAAGFSGQMLTVALTRPAPLILLAMGIFYLWVYVRPDSVQIAAADGETRKTRRARRLNPTRDEEQRLAV
jgi:hypothetical protein